MLNNRSMPVSGVIPVLGYPDVSQAARWLCVAFGFRERLVIADHRIQLHAGSGAVVVARGAATNVSAAPDIPELVASCASRIPSPFFSVDVARRSDGTLGIVEIGDGQVSDRKEWSPQQMVEVFARLA